MASVTEIEVMIFLKQLESADFNLSPILDGIDRLQIQSSLKMAEMFTINKLLFVSDVVRKQQTMH